MATMTLEKRKGTIANVLTAHQSELYAFLDAGDIKGCKESN